MKYRIPRKKKKALKKTDWFVEAFFKWMGELHSPSYFERNSIAPMISDALSDGKIRHVLPLSYLRNAQE